ncbi:MAG: hypothetical protein ABH840_00925 [Nanoarchaeota archaeon]
MKKLVLCILVLSLFLVSFVSAESKCNSDTSCNDCNGNTPKEFNITFEGMRDCSTGELDGINGAYKFVQHEGSCMWVSVNAPHYMYADFWDEKFQITIYANGDTTNFKKAFPNSCTDGMVMENEYTLLSPGSADFCEGTATVTPCKKNTAPTITNASKIIYLQEKNNTLSLNKTGEKSGKMKINSKVYNTFVSDNETKVEDLKLQIGSSKITPATQVKFNPEDIGLVFKNLPLVGRFVLNVTDDGTINEQTEKGENKSGFIDTKVLWCPENISLYGAYDVGLVAKGSIWWFVFKIFDDGETIIQRALKEMSSTLVFTNDEKTPLKGEFHIHIINERVQGLTNSKERVDASRSKAIKELQAKMEKSLGKMPSQIARWGCKPDPTYGDKWGKFKFPDPNDADKEIEIEVCKEYTSEIIEYDMVYSFEKRTFTLWGGSGGNVKQMKISVPLDKFILILDELADDDPSAIKPPARLKVGWRGEKDWSWGVALKPTDMIAKVKNLLLMCEWNSNQNKVVDAEKDKIKKTITTTSKKSYYYVQEFQSKEDSTIKISLDVPILEPITKIFNYSQINFTDEDLVSLYRYGDNEIEDNCYIDIISETNFSVSSIGESFSVSDLEIIIPENAVESNGILTIQKINVTNCIKNADINKDKKIQTMEMIKYIYEDYNSGKNDYLKVLELLFRWRTS